MGKKLFIGNINFKATKENLEEVFAQYGELEEVILVKDEQGRSKGFGFVSYTSEENAQEALKALNGFEIDGRALFVNEARPQEKRERNF
ncbi:RNA-binding protein [Candidatus Gracilibacteria bacterium]|nr:RNA-binding protein [Candidatus Gracilibacteria bacterium]